MGNSQTISKTLYATALSKTSKGTNSNSFLCYNICTSSYCLLISSCTCFCKLEGSWMNEVLEARYISTDGANGLTAVGWKWVCNQSLANLITVSRFWTSSHIWPQNESIKGRIIFAISKRILNRKKGKIIFPKIIVRTASYGTIYFKKQSHTSQKR